MCVTSYVHCGLNDFKSHCLFTLKWRFLLCLTTRRKTHHGQKCVCVRQRWKETCNREILNAIKKKEHPEVTESPSYVRERTQTTDNYPPNFEFQSCLSTYRISVSLTGCFFVSAATSLDARSTQTDSLHSLGCNLSLFTLPRGYLAVC